jgi:hypothetical protein
MLGAPEQSQNQLANGIDRGEYSRKWLYLMLRKIPQELVRQ